MDDLFKALEMFKSGVQQYAITGAVNDANATMQQLNQSQIDEGQKRQQLQQLANGLALQLTGANASGTQIQSAFNAINPQNFGSVEQMQLEGELQGNDYLTGTANQILSQREQRGIDAEKRQFGRQLALQDRNFQQQLMLEALKNRQSGASLKKPGASEIKRADDAAMALQGVSDMEKALFQDGYNTFSLVGDNPFTEASRRFEESFGRLQSGGAITKDEEERFQKLRPKATDSLEIQQQKLMNLKEQLQKVYQNTGVPQYNLSTGQGVATPTGQVQNIQVKVLPNGQRVKVRQIAPGKYEEVP